MSQARYGGNSSYGRVEKNYDPTLERPTRFTRSDKQLAGTAALGTLGVGQLVGAARLPSTARTQLNEATAMARETGNRVKLQEQRIKALRVTGNKPVNLGLDRDRPGGPLKNWANRRRLKRQMPRLQSQYMDAKSRVSTAHEAIKPANLARRQRSLALTGAAVTGGAALLGRQAWKNRKAEQEAGIR